MVVVVVVWVLLVAAAAAVLELVVVVVVVLAFCRVALGLFRFAEVASRTGDSVALWLTRLVGFLPRGKLHCARRLFRHGFACMLKHRPPASRHLLAPLASGAARTRRKPLLG